MNKIQKLLLTVLSFSFIIWFGGALLRSSMAYDLFVPGAKLVLKSNYTLDTQMQTVYLFSILSFYTNIAYCLVFITGLILFYQFRNILRDKGWLFMCFVLFFMASPIELYKIFLDYRLSMAVYWDNLKDFNSEIIQRDFIDRFKNMTINTFSGLSFLSNITVILFMVWQPLNKKINE